MNWIIVFVNVDGINQKVFDLLSDVFAFSTDLIKVVIWPVTLVTILLTFRKPIIKLLERLGSAELKIGENEFKIKLEKAEKESRKLEIPSPDEGEYKKAISEIKSPDELMSLAETSPRDAIRESWRTVEASTVSVPIGLRRGPRIKKPYSSVSAIAYLEDTKSLITGTTGFYEDLHSINILVTDYPEIEVGTDSAKRYVDLTLGLAGKIIKSSKE